MLSKISFLWSKRIFEQYICTSAQFHIMNFNQLKSSLVSSLLDMTIFVSLQKYCDTPLFSNSPWSLAVIVMLTEFRMFATDPRFPRFDPWTFPSSGKWPKVGGSQFKGNKVVLKDVFEVTWGRRNYKFFAHVWVCNRSRWLFDLCQISHFDTCAHCS